MVAVNTDLSKAIENYYPLTSQELDGNDYIKIYVNDEQSNNLLNIVKKIKLFFNI